jgi:RNA polymerase sigma factor (sigma-70 family)
MIMARLHSFFSNYEGHPDFEDLVSDVKTKLLKYLEELKANRAARPCKDFHGYVAGIVHNACNDFLRQMYPARTRLYKQIRDLLCAHPDFAIWRSKDENNRSDWLCGFSCWQGERKTSKAADWLQQFFENPRATFEAVLPGTDIQLVELDDLLAAIFNCLGEAINLDDIVSVVADLKGVKDLPTVSFDSDEDNLAQSLSDSRIRIDTVLEMREPLKVFWEGLCQLPRDEFKAYVLYAHDTSGEDLITLFLAAKIVTDVEIARILDISVKEFQDLWLNRLPLDNESIAKELGVKVERVYKLRCQAGKRLKMLLSRTRLKI